MRVSYLPKIVKAVCFFTLFVAGAPRISLTKSALSLGRSLSAKNLDGVYSKRYVVSREQRSPETVLYLPGQGDAISMYRYLAKDLNLVLKMDVTMIDLRGQGRSAGIRCHIDDYQEYEVDFQKTLSRLESEYKAIHVISHSTGGLISSIHLLSKDNGKIASLSLLAPFFSPTGQNGKKRMAESTARWFNNRGLGALRVFPFDPVSIFSSTKHNIITTNGAAFHRFNQHPDKCGVPTFAWIDASFKAQKLLVTLTRRSEVPVLMLTAGKDRVVSTRVAKEQCQFWNQRKILSCNYHEYPDKMHGLVYETPSTHNDLLQRIKGLVRNARPTFPFRT